MANDNQIQMDFLINDKSVKTQFAKVEDQAKKTSDKINNNSNGFKSIFNLEKVKDALSFDPSSLINPYTVLATAVGFAAKKTAEFIFESEKATAIGYQFRAAAESAGLASEQLSASLIKATDGLIDDEDALQLATKGIIALGNEAKKLPEVLDLSRRVSKALGKDFKDTFADLSQFLEAGNLKALRQYGIVLDLESAYKKAAASIGVASSELTEQQKQAIRTAELLEQLPRKFSAAAQSVTPLSDAFDRLWVKTLNQFEEIGKAIAESLAQTFVDSADKSNVASVRLESQLKAVSSQISSINSRIEEIKLDKLGSKSVQAASEVESLSRSLKGLREEQSLLLAELSGRSDQQLFADLEATRAATSEVILKRNEEQNKLIKARETELTSFLKQQNILRLQADLENVNQKDILSQQATSLQLRQQQELEILKIQHEQNLANIEKQFSTDKFFTTAQADQAKLAAEQTYQAQRQKIVVESSEKIAELEQNIASNSLNNIADALKYVGTQAKTQLGNVFVNSMQAATDAIARGEDGMDALVKSVLKSIGDIAVQFGTLFLLQAAGFSVIPGLQGSAGTLAAAGAGLIGLGIALKALAGGGAQQKGSDQQSSTFAPIGNEPVQEDQLQSKDARVQVNISGDVFDTEETGLRIVDILNKSFDQQGVQVRGMA